MKTKKVQFKILWATLALCACIYIDVLFIPSSTSVETCTKLTMQAGRGRYSGRFFYLKTEKSTYSVNEAIYELAEVGSKVTIVRSAATNARRKLQIKATNGVVVAESDLRMIEDSGMFYLSFISVMIIMFMLAYKKVTYVTGRMHLTLYFVASSFFLLFLHLRGAVNFW